MGPAVQVVTLDGEVAPTAKGAALGDQPSRLGGRVLEDQTGGRERDVVEGNLKRHKLRDCRWRRRRRA